MFVWHQAQMSWCLNSLIINFRCMNCKNTFAHAAHLGSEPSDGQSDSLRKTVFSRRRWVSTSHHRPSVEMMSFRKRHLANRVRAIQKRLKYGTKKRSTVSLLTPVMFMRTRLPCSPVFSLSQMDSLWQVSCDDDDFLSADYLKHTSQNLLKVGHI